ncbi:transcriptional regulator [Nocardia sp. CDC159]|uniref:Transcriptional regulator n=1 Tax=Nocardia pulmonis TaxID=2951408 RepID=A0A9X2E9B9_9NOCA|nr:MULTISPECIES: helix-turn-helix domain-containing protein [Nocardia]MCM6775230.1 transcriptional regulator [Nocardia pulmonis]MCM6788036.1 transcriptional regulator [Nocardia sp. CDC159]
MPQNRTLSQRRAALEQEWARWAATRAAVPGDTLLRTEVVQSWQRSLPTVDPGCAAAPADDAEIGARWAHSPLRGPVTELADELRSITDDSGFVAAVTDERGTILWSCGGRVMRRRAEAVNFAPGGRWDETHMGTNALSLALRTGQPSTVFSAEHLVAALHGWVCYCAPIHAPDGRQLGVLDLSTTWDRSHPLAMSTVRALVSAIESRLPAQPPARGCELRLDCLGTAILTRSGAPIRLRPRQLEILTLLALEPDGYTPQRLQAAVYGDRPVAAATLKADVSHLRRATGGDISSRRYLLTRPISCDAVELLAAIAAGDVATALRLYRGPLLPDSDTPGIVEWREYLLVGLRTAVLSSRNPTHLVEFGARCPADAEVHERALRLLAADDPRRALVAARLHNALR